MVMLHGDCLELLPTVADGSVSMVFGDLPYGVTRNKWDTPIDLAALWAELLRVGKRNAAFVFTATQPFATALINSQPKLFRYDLVWDKANPVGHLNANRQPMRRHEDVLVFYAGQPTYNPQKTPGKPYSRGKRPANPNFGAVNVNHEHKNETGERHPHSIVVVATDRHLAQHPTQKPVTLLEWLIRTYTNPGETVLDPTAGAGSTGLACINTDRKFIGIEKDATYYAVARNRLETAYESQARLILDEHRPDGARPRREGPAHRRGHQLALASCHGPAVAVPAP